MDADLVLIFTFVTVALVITAFALNGIVSKILDYKKSQDMRSDSANGRSQDRLLSSDLAERTDMIEDRLRVLERLATDRGQMLADEIEALRGDQTRGAQLENTKQ